MGYIIIIIFIVSAIIYTYITCSFPTLLIISFVLGMLVALAKLLNFKRYNGGAAFELTSAYAKFKSFETAPSIEEIMKWKRIGMENKEKEERKKREEREERGE